MDWIGTFCSLAGLFANARKYIACWPIWCIGTAAWSIFAIRTHQHALLITQIGFMTFNIYGWWSWERAK